MPTNRPERYSPFALRTGPDACPRWIDLQIRSVSDPDEPFNRWNIRNFIVAALADAQAAGEPPDQDSVRRPPMRALLPEERWYFEHFVETYCEVFGGSSGRTVPHGCDRAQELRGVLLSGAVDLLIERPDGSHQLRQLELWGRPLIDDAALSWELTLALLRLRRFGGFRGKLDIAHVDLSDGSVVESTVELDDFAVGAVDRLEQVIPEIRSRASSPFPVPGASCGFCAHIPGCEAWQDRPAIAPLPTGERNPFVGRVVRLSPTSVEAWVRCPRKWRAKHSLGLPGWPMTARGHLGIEVHAALHRLHDAGPCAEDPARRIDAATVDGVLDETLLAHLERHAVRCPSNGSPAGSEIDLAELVSEGPNAVMVTARIDAIWSHDGVLDCRDYKVGLPFFDRVADDVRAQVQAVVLAPLAAKLGLRLRLRYEHLADGEFDDPEPWEPDEEEIAQARERLANFGHAIRQSDFAGVADPTECRRCPYWRACPDSAADEADEDFVLTVLGENETDW